jgi:hypothetical protein
MRSFINRKLTTLAVLLAVLGCSDSDPPTGAGGGAGATGGAAEGAGGTAGAGGISTGGGTQVVELEAPPSFAALGDGSYEMTDGFAVFDVTQALYQHYDDDYDFVIIFSDFLVADIWQYELTTRVDVQGIGQDLIYQQQFNWPLDWTEQAGSDGRLQAVVFMNGPSLWDQSAFTVQDILTHEVGHRWGACLQTSWESDPMLLIDQSFAHWTIIGGLGGPSALGYGQTVDNGGGSFTNTAVKPLRYAPLELYAMGLLAPDDPLLDGLFYVPDPHSFAPATDGVGAPWSIDSLNAHGTVTFSGTRVDFTIDQLVAALGPRIPTHDTAQTEFRFAFVVLCPPGGTCASETVSWVDAQRTSYEATFATATGDRGTAQTDL